MQEFIPGGDDHIISFHGYSNEHSDLLGWFISRKIRTYPRDTGESSLLESLPPDDHKRFIGVAQRAVRQFGLKGAFKLDFKQHEQTGEYHLLEINCRFNLWHYLGTANGINLPMVACQYLTGRYVPNHNRYQTRFCWINLHLDPQSLLGGYNAGLDGLWPMDQTDSQ